MAIVTKLTPKQQDEIVEATTKENPLGGLEKCWEILLGKPLSEHEGKIDPRAYSIPKDQTIELLNRMITKLPYDYRVSLNMHWCNVGPSSAE